MSKSNAGPWAEDTDERSDPERISKVAPQSCPNRTGDCDIWQMQNCSSIAHSVTDYRHQSQLDLNLWIFLAGSARTHVQRADSRCNRDDTGEQRRKRARFVRFVREDCDQLSGEASPRRDR
mgnify:FL=1